MLSFYDSKIVFEHQRKGAAVRPCSLLFPGNEGVKSPGEACCPTGPPAPALLLPAKRQPGLLQQERDLHPRALVQQDESLCAGLVEAARLNCRGGLSVISLLPGKRTA